MASTTCAAPRRANHKQNEKESRAMNLSGIRVPILDTRTLARRVERRFVTCFQCHKTSTLDLTVHVWEFKWFNWQYGRDVWEDRVEYTDESRKEYPDGYIAQCPLCGASRPSNRRLKAKYSAKRECNDKCRDAISDTCTCRAAQEASMGLTTSKRI